MVAAIFAMILPLGPMRRFSMEELGFLIHIRELTLVMLTHCQLPEHTMINSDVIFVVV